VPVSFSLVALVVLVIAYAMPPTLHAAATSGRTLDG